MTRTESVLAVFLFVVLCAVPCAAWFALLWAVS